MSINRRTFLRLSGSGAAMMVAGPALLKNNVYAAEPNQKISNVSFVGSNSSGNRKTMILDVLEPWRQTITDGIKGKKILIKPNVVASTNALVATHVDALRALIQFLRTITDQPIIIAESAASFGVSFGFSNFGYNNLPSEFQNISLMDLDNQSTIPKVDRTIWKPDLSSSVQIPVYQAFVDPEYYVISICRPKTHNCMVITGVCKNILMAAPQMDSKQQMHGQKGWYSGTNEGENKCLAYNLYQLGNIIFTSGAPAFCVLDAWEGMEGNGPASGTSIMQYCAIAGTDPLAVDRLCAKLMGFSDTPTEPMNNSTPSYTDARALWWLSNAGIGNFDLNKINFILGSLDELNNYVKSYQLPSNYTGNPSYETEWTGGPPDTVFDKTATATHKHRSLDPKPYLFPQVQSIRGSLINITFTLPTSYSVSIKIFNLQGKEVRKLGNQYLQAGKYSVKWDRQSNRGTIVPSGRYIIQLNFEGRVISDQVTLL